MSEHSDGEDDAWMEQSAFNPLAKPEVFWKKGSRNIAGDERPDKLWQSVGLALTSYEHLEEQLAEIFGFFIESKSKAALKAYGVSTGRQNLLSQASREFFDRRNGYIADIDEFKTLIRHYSCAASFRNDVAHGIVRNFRLDDSDTVGRWFLVAPSYNTRKTTLSAKYRHTTYKLDEVASTYIYSSAGVEKYSLRCSALQKRLHFFFIEMIQVYEHDVLTGFDKFPQIFNRPDKRRINDDHSPK